MALSYFAGTFNALDYNYGGSSAGAAAMQVTSGSTATGAYTLTCSPAALYTPAGKPIPVSTATPINVGANSGFDLSITPTTVSQSGLNTLLITGTFTYAHGPGAQVSSATFGLAEALLAASKYGGGTVAVDAKWFAAGGTQAILNAATQYAGVTIQDTSSPDTLAQSITVTLTNAQILAMFTTPVQLLPTTDSSSFYQITNATLVNANTGTAYTAGGAMTVGYGTTTATTQALSGTIAATFLTSPVVSQVITLAGATLASSTASTYTGKGIWITCATQNFATGTGTLLITLNYTKVYV